ncbi:MAG TPA: hypothetical protein PLE48_11705 [Thiobacillus sp.]|nr:hypothetical protein [Thiobacillus sp.]HQT71077.1 hypothetical protein [Thiobacillus sp.]
MGSGLSKSYDIERPDPIVGFIKMGLFVGGAGLELVDEKEGKEDIMELDLAKQGTCS